MDKMVKLVIINMVEIILFQIVIMDKMFKLVILFFLLLSIDNCTLLFCPLMCDVHQLEFVVVIVVIFHVM